MSMLNLERNKRNKAKSMNVTLLKKNKGMSEDERTTGSVFSDPWIHTALTKRRCIRMDNIYRNCLCCERKQTSLKVN